jgi:cytochrome b6-f complex iron-sulfur subunit
MTRRDLIQKVVIGGVTLVFLPPVLDSCSKDSTINDGNGGPNPGDKITLDLTDPKYSALNTAGGSIIVQGIIVAYRGNDLFLALDSTCTHQGCTIGYSLASNNFPCPCHGSVYSSTGSIVNGPATVALKSYQATKSGNILTILL